MQTVPPFDPRLRGRDGIIVHGPGVPYKPVLTISTGPGFSGSVVLPVVTGASTSAPARAGQALAADPERPRPATDPAER